MALGTLTRAAVEQAVAEFDDLGREEFLRKYGFGPATQYVLRVDGREYDPKAIAGVAYKYDHPDEGPLPNTAFSGGLELLPAYRATGYVVEKRRSSSAEIRALLQRVFATYRAARTRKWNGQDEVNLLFRDLEKSFAELEPVSGRPTVNVKASTGLGNWAAAPWVALLDSRETSSTQNGVYPVLLFREDMSGLYFTVAQGVTQPGTGGAAALNEHLQRTAARVVGALSSDIAETGFVVGSDIDLRSTGSLARKYERSTIVHKFYDADDLPDDAEIEADLETVLRVIEDYLTVREAPAVPGAASLEAAAQSFRQAVEASGLIVPPGPGDRVITLLAALVTKPFVILSGLSGSGKTQLALRLGEWFGAAADGHSRALSVAVRPDWTGPEALFGYEDALKKPVDGKAAWFVPEALRFILRAASEPDMPYLLLLDEMNLAHVERYFSDFLSGIESRASVVPNVEPGTDGEWRAGTPAAVPLPRNLMVVGTVNVDETTYQFSPKVLDRAFTFEVRTTTEELSTRVRRPVAVPPGEVGAVRAIAEAAVDDAWQERHQGQELEAVGRDMRRLHEVLTETGDEFGHRVFYEALRFTAALRRTGQVGADLALDQVVLLKVLPRVSGSRRRVEPLLRRLAVFAADPGASGDLDEPQAAPRLPLSAAKVDRMLRILEVDQFVSFTS